MGETERNERLEKRKREGERKGGREREVWGERELSLEAPADPLSSTHRLENEEEIPVPTHRG